MGIYAYCVVPAGHAPAAPLFGLDNVRVELQPVGDLGVWVTRGARPEGSVANIKVHNSVVEAAVTQEVTPVPLRFGQWLEDDAALLTIMREQAASYQEKLREFAGCLEFGIRLIDPAAPAHGPAEPPAKPASGYAYMQALRESSRLEAEKQSAAQQVRTRVQEVLQDIVRAEREEESRTPHAVVTLTHLVARAHFDEYRERARRLRELFPALRLLLSGPWPPYSFAV